jgi:hypothetical protein
MSGHGIIDRDQRVALAPGPRWSVAVIVVAVWTVLTAVAVAGVAALFGAGLHFDAAPVTSIAGIVALASVVTASIVGAAAAYIRRWRVVTDPTYDLDPMPLDDVPERAALRQAKARAIAARLERQRAARNHTAASGGNVSSTEAGLPPHGSSEATTEP